MRFMVKGGEEYEGARFEDDDFGDELTPELREQEQRIREQVEQES